LRCVSSEQMKIHDSEETKQQDYIETDESSDEMYENVDDNNCDDKQFDLISSSCRKVPIFG
jgi:hypothetical protein